MARRSLTSLQNIKKGTKLSKELISIRRPATGIPPAEISKIIGKQAKRSIKSNETIKWKDLK